MSIVSLFEYGRKAHPGYYREFYTLSNHADIAFSLHDLVVPNVVRDQIIKFFVDALQSDNRSFNGDEFKKNVVGGRNRETSPQKYGHRHFYYLAHAVSMCHEQQREYLAWFLHKFFYERSDYFKSDDWFKGCDVPYSK